MHFPVSRAIDVTMGACTHNMLAPPAVPSPTPVPSIEMIATQMWTLGFLVGQNKFAMTVVTFGVPIAQGDHDLGMMIPDVTIPPAPNVYYAIAWPFSSRKMVFKASTVKMKGSPTGVASLLMPMLTCGDPVTLPTSKCLSNVMCSVQVNLTFGDFLMGLLNIALSVAIDAFFEYLKVGKNIFGSGLSREVAQQVGQQGWRATVRAAGRTLGSEALGKLVPTSWNAAGKRLASAAAGLLTSSLEGNPTFQYGVVTAPGATAWVGHQPASGDNAARNPGGADVFGSPVL